MFLSLQLPGVGYPKRPLLFTYKYIRAPCHWSELYPLMGRARAFILPWKWPVLEQTLLRVRHFFFLKDRLSTSLEGFRPPIATLVPREGSQELRAAFTHLSTVELTGSRERSSSLGLPSAEVCWNSLPQRTPPPLAPAGYPTELQAKTPLTNHLLLFDSLCYNLAPTGLLRVCYLSATAKDRNPGQAGLQSCRPKHCRKGPSQDTHRVMPKLHGAVVK
jgi:hypothetical protein